MVSVYQEPAIIPDLTVLENLSLTETPVDAFAAELEPLGIGGLDLRAMAGSLPLATLRVIDLARALAIEPDILLLDEMTAALPADLTAARARGDRPVPGTPRGRSSSSRIACSRSPASATRATVLRNGATVGVVDMGPGAEERIVSLMLGPVGEAAAEEREAAPVAETRSRVPPPRPRCRGSRRETCGPGATCPTSPSRCAPGRCSASSALEGQGQDELFDVLSGQARPSGGELLVDGSPVRFGHPADAIRAGIVLVPADRGSALLMQRSVRENIAVPRIAGLRRWGPIDMRRESAAVRTAIDRLQIDTRAQSEVRRLSGGNQQKVTIARWLGAGVRTFLFYDPTRGIDIRTKQEIYELVRELAAAGAAVLLLTSELEEIQRVCDRAIVIFGGRVVDELPAARRGRADPAARGSRSARAASGARLTESPTVSGVASRVRSA